MLDERVASSGGDAAHVVQVARHANVAVLAPARRPRILHDPKVLLFAALGHICAITDHNDAVVEFNIRARIVHKDALLVQHELVLGDVNGDRDGPHRGQRLLQSVLVAALDVNVAGQGGTDGLLVKVTLLLVRMVRIGVLGVQASVLLDVLERVVHEAAVAALVVELARTVD